MKKVVIGGTFDILHEGHRALLRNAFELGEVTIGLTSDAMARAVKGREVKDFLRRKKELEDFIEKEFKVTPKILKIEDKFGPTLTDDFDCIVVSPETYNTALLINQERQRRGKNHLEIIKIDFVLAEDGQPISSNRIYKGEINGEGRMLS